jgi:SAM-dependent methyltransferase
MKCPRCLKHHEESATKCSCGFSFDTVSSSDLEGWFDEVKRVLETAYTVAPTPWQQSGKSGTFEEWTRLRLPNVAAVNRPGSYLDIGCANGYLLECLLAWTKLKGVEIVPYGLDYSAELVALAQERLPLYATNFYISNAFYWQPPLRFDYVRTELAYVPRNYRRSFIERLMADFLTAEGKLILSDYRSRRDDLTQGWIEAEIRGWGFEVEEIFSGYGKDGLELCRVVVLPRGNIDQEEV